MYGCVYACVSVYRVYTCVYVLLMIRLEYLYVTGDWLSGEKTILRWFENYLTD